MIDPMDLLTLLATARARTQVAAAAALGVDHSTVGRRLRRLEQAVGERLVVNAPGGWTLTNTGREVLAAAEAVEAAVNLVPGPERRRSVGEMHGLVTVSSTELFGIRVVAPALSRIRIEHPAVGFELSSVTRPAPPHGPAADIDIGVTRPRSRRLHVRKLTDYEIGLYASREYLERAGRPSELADLAQHTLIYYIESMLQVVDLDLANRIPGRAEMLGATSVLAQAEMTRKGAGIGILPVFLGHFEPELVRVLPVEGRALLTFWMSARPENLRRPEVRFTATAIEQRCAEVFGRLPPPTLPAGATRASARPPTAQPRQHPQGDNGADP